MLLFFCKYRCFCAIKISANFGVSEEVYASILRKIIVVNLNHMITKQQLKWI